jgi:putative protein-disulfide isomerase
MTHASDTLVLHYVYDPLCGWCYGFSPVISKIRHTYLHKVRFEVISGGLAIGPRAAPVKEAYGYIKGALPVVENRTGVRFGDKFRQNILEEGTYVYNSDPPNTAMTVFKEFRPEEAIAFAHDMQTAFFYEGKSLNDLSTYIKLIEKYAIDPTEFSRRFSLPEYAGKTQQEYALAQQLGVNGFPTLILETPERLIVLSRGYTDYPTTTANLEKALALVTG